MKTPELNKIYQGDTLEVLKSWPDDFVDTIITSPPYWGLRDYGEQTRVVWGGDGGCEHGWGEPIKGRVDETGFERNRRGLNKAAEIADGNPRTATAKVPVVRKESQFCSKCGAWYGQLGLEPTLDMFLDHLLAITKELQRVLKPTGVMFWNHGDCYGGSGHGTSSKAKVEDSKESYLLPFGKNVTGKSKAKCLALQNYRLIIRMVESQGWILRNTIVWHKPNAMPSSVKDRFSNSYEPVFMLVKKKRYWFDLDAVRVPHKTDFDKLVASGGASDKYDGSDKKLVVRERVRPNPSGKNPGDVWRIPTHPFPEAHFATFPPKLIEPMIKSSCPKWVCKKCGKARVRISKASYEVSKEKPDPKKVTEEGKRANQFGTMRYAKATAQHKTIGWTDCGCNKGWKAGIVLDPFMGSGTTALVARKLARNYLGIELSGEYIKIAEERLKQEHLGI